MPGGRCDGIQTDCKECQNIRANRRMIVRLIGFGFVFGILIAIMHQIGTR